MCWRSSSDTDFLLLWGKQKQCNEGELTKNVSAETGVTYRKSAWKARMLKARETFKVPRTSQRTRCVTAAMSSKTQELTETKAALSILSLSL